MESIAQPHQKVRNQYRPNDLNPQFCNSVLENLQHKIMWMDFQGNIVYANSKFCERLGYKKSEITNLSIFDVNPESNGETWYNHWNYLKANGSQTFKSIHQTKDEKYYEVEVYAQYHIIDGREIVSALVNDISQSSFYRNLLNHAERMTNVGGWKLNLQDGSLIVTKQTLKIFSTSNKEDLLPKNLIYLFEETDKVKELIRNLIRKGASYDEIFTQKCKDESIRYIRSVAEPILKGDKIYKIVGTYQDVTKETELLNEMSVLKENLQEDNQNLRKEINANVKFDNIICGSESYRQVLELVTRVAVTDSTVLITGESGTGKELLAKAVHLNSPRKDKTLIKVNCATLPKELIESELFGHKKGAFTGAISDKLGKFSLADKGTLFLDEIGEMPLDLQSKLLRVLQEGEFDQLGANTTCKVDVRVVAATNRDLGQMVKEGSFRQDLYYRLNVFPIHNIPLRDRREDIPLLAQFFLDKYSKKAGKSFKRLSKQVIDALMEYSFPGNIRELENLIERAVIVEDGTTLNSGSWLPKKGTASLPGHFKPFVDVQREYIINVLNYTKWRVSGPTGAAKILEMNDKTLFARMKKLGINKQVSLKEL
ncbi:MULTISPECIES: sigma 54-interacting transcriptional regulator [Flavobacteriaceae]|uniref:sigma 54-interacting transcriptional regulator n=1 Tax=Flavobacteriaceae TaxID=49546 RepID=UPI0021D1F9D2|nr:MULTISPECIES: sigma 54-interacting transcriptional regulator [Allomuricauda]MDC6366198.1 sigma 54-interacting transcriptional regulator [Muricauda sp. AC10]